MRERERDKGGGDVEAAEAEGVKRGVVTGIQGEQ